MIFVQVVTLTTYSFLVASILGRQYTDADVDKIFPIDVYFPIWSILQILFYMGLLKVYIYLSMNLTFIYFLNGSGF